MKCFRLCTASLVCGVSLLLAGCGTGTGTNNPGVTVHPAGGKVLVDGAPMEGVTVILKGDERGASAKSNAQGEFTFTTFDPGDGVPEGTYKVAVLKRETVGADSSYFDENSPNYGKTPPPEALGKVVDHIAEKYADAETSGLTADVKPGANEFTFEVTSK
ncbi:hypothetical protein Poly24_24440 [Rosistilla carotiformis]|uniref:Carboxypeptidase regulatory-like domain-containing protein n=1 Tax=Rosistilla carotiformis TaxID=2528017 RepID=A0A518JT60_9BACT|nr:carboxypeptidase-like regulatory domain-containing protein [Rosistilla carotiformis]QDV68731.1 hypothetical protein Poly24_24440 [Rosistilla carotiformis]